MAHRLAVLLDQAAHGRFPAPDGTVEVAGSLGGRADAVVAFTGHFVVAADVDPHEVARRAPAGDFSAPFAPAFLAWIGTQIGSHPATHDALFVARARAGASEIALERVEASNHPRVARAGRYRDDPRVYVTADGAGVLILGRGITNRWEIGFEIDPAARDRGLGRKLAAAALHLLPTGTPVWAQVAPGNAASLRTVGAAGYRPVGAEVLFPRSAAASANPSRHE